MKKFKNSQSVADQSNAKKSQKHDANVQKNTILYFQVGLILCLLGTYTLFEMQFKKTNLNFDDTATATEDNFEVAPEVFKIYKEEIKVEVKQKQKKILTDKYVKVEDDYPEKILTDIITPEENVTSKLIDPNELDEIYEPIEPIEIFNIKGVEQVPIYPGCEKASNNDERIQCMSKKLNKLILKKFDRDLAYKLGLSGLQKIYVEFKIDKDGNVSVINTRAPHKALNKEAERMVNKIPKMKPGLQRNEPVNVKYMLPILFKVQD